MVNTASISLAKWLFERSRLDVSVEDHHDLEEGDCEEVEDDERGAQALTRDRRLMPQYVHMLLDWLGLHEE